MNAHDPLCGNRCCTPNTCTHNCRCDLIPEARADERHKVMAEGPYFTSVVHDCCVPRTWMRRCGSVWACSCGRLWTLGFVYDFLSTSKAWVPLDEVQRLALKQDKS